MPLAFLANPAFWQGAAGAAGVGSAISGLFGNKKGKVVDVESMLPSWQRDSARGLSNWAKQYMGNFIPGEAYGGKLSAGATPYEQTGLGWLSDYLKQPALGDLYGAGKQQLLDTLGGKYADVQNSPWIKSMVNLSKMNLGDLVNEARARRGARGTYYTEEGLREEGRLGERTQNYLDSIIGKFIESERGRQFSALEPALKYEEYGANAPLSKVAAAQNYGAFDRLLEQADLERKYNEFQRQRQEMAMPLEAARGLAGGQPFLAQRQAPSEPSTISNILNIMNQIPWEKLGGIFTKKNVGTALTSSQGNWSPYSLMNYFNQ